MYLAAWKTLSTLQSLIAEICFENPSGRNHGRLAELNSCHLLTCVILLCIGTHKTRHLAIRLIVWGWVAPGLYVREWWWVRGTWGGCEGDEGLWGGYEGDRVERGDPSPSCRRRCLMSLESIQEFNEVQLKTRVLWVEWGRPGWGGERLLQYINPIYTYIGVWGVG